MNKLSTENLHLIPKYDELKQLCYSYINDYYQGAFESQKLKAETVALIYQQQILTEELARKINHSLETLIG